MPSCPTCERTVPLPTDAIEGEILACQGCGAEVEVLRVQPPALALAPEMAEDWGE